LVGLWIGLGCLKIETGGDLFWMRWRTFAFLPHGVSYHCLFICNLFYSAFPVTKIHSFEWRVMSKRTLVKALEGSGCGPIPANLGIKLLHIRSVSTTI
jgi:hypothetical protein